MSDALTRTLHYSLPICVALDIPGLNVRQAIGIGRTDDPDAAIIEASGEAFIYSGKLLDQLTASGRRLGLRTPWEEINREFDMMFRLVRVILNGWTDRKSACRERE